jgi:hypothetical protein
MNKIEESLKLITKYGFAKDKQAAIKLATALRKSFQKFDQGAVDKLLTHFRGSVEETAMALWGGTWVDVVKKAEAPEPVQPTGRTSGLKWCSAENPYGWSTEVPPRHFKSSSVTVKLGDGEDHNRPGKWNAYRQTFNMTVKERADAGTHDYRRRGCSRAEVVGWVAIPSGWRPGMKLPEISNLRAPKAVWDPMEVQAAMAQYGPEA